MVFTNKLTWKTIPKIPVFFPGMNDGDSKSNELEIDHQILPPPVKHVLAPQNEFVVQKNTWSIYKKIGNWGGPPPLPPIWEKFPK